MAGEGGIREGEVLFDLEIVLGGDGGTIVPRKYGLDPALDQGVPPVLGALQRRSSTANEAPRRATLYPRVAGRQLTTRTTSTPDSRKDAMR